MDQPLELWRIRGLRDLGSVEEAAADERAVLLVGRDEELGLLRRRWEQSKEGLGQVVLITGEAGIGKSSLVQVLRAQVAQEGLPRITFRCSPYHTNSALYPTITHLHRLLRFEREDPPDVKLAKVERGLQPYALPMAERGAACWLPCSRSHSRRAATRPCPCRPSSSASRPSMP